MLVLGSFNRWPATHLLLCDPIPNSPPTSTNLWPLGLGTPALEEHTIMLNSWWFLNQWSANTEKSHITVDNMTDYLWSLTSKRPSALPRNLLFFLLFSFQRILPNFTINISNCLQCSQISITTLSLSSLYFIAKLVAIRMQYQACN